MPVHNFLTDVFLSKADREYLAKMTGMVADSLKRGVTYEPRTPNPDDPLAMRAYLAERGQLHAIGQAPHEPYAAAEVCQHAFAYDTGVCMACGVSAQSARIAKKPKPAIPADTPHASWYAHIGASERPFKDWADSQLCMFYAECDAVVLGPDRINALHWEITERALGEQAGAAYRQARDMGLGVWAKEKRAVAADPLAAYRDMQDAVWGKLKTEFDKREPCVAVLDREGDLVGVNPIPPGMIVNGFTKEDIFPSAPMTKTEAQLHHLTSVLGSREKALDHWKECHLADRAKRNAREHADYNDSAAMTKGLYEHGRAQELEQAMSRPLTAEKSMRAQILLREDD